MAHGFKGYETRGWATRYRGPIALHAAKRWTLRMALQCYEEPFFTLLSRAGVRFPARCDGTRLQGLGLAFGAIIAVAELVDVRDARSVLAEIGGEEKAFGDFRHGRYAWRIANVRRLESPLELNGRQGLFDVDDGLIYGAMEMGVTA